MYVDICCSTDSMTCGSPVQITLNWVNAFVCLFCGLHSSSAKEIPGSRHDRNQLPCRCILHLISLSLKQAQAKPDGLRPLNVVVPADPHNQTEEWKRNMAAKVPNPKQFPAFKNDTKYEPGVEYFANICFRVPFYLFKIDRCILYYIHKITAIFLATVGPVLTKRTAAPHQSHEYAYYVSRPILAHPRLWLFKNIDQRANTSRYLPNHICLVSLTFPALELGDFVELFLLHICSGMSWLLIKALSFFPLETTQSDSHTLDRKDVSFTCQFCTTTSTMLAALWLLEFAVARFCYLKLK